MTVVRPTRERIETIAASLGMHLSPEDASAFEAVIARQCEVYDVLDAMPDFRPSPGRGTSIPYRYPSATENPLGAWHVTTSIPPTRTGVLADRRVAIKDSIAVAGLPMVAGSATMIDPDTREGYVAVDDATVVTRLLEAGATIAGKAVCECFCFSGNSHTSVHGPVRNPRRRTHSAGGSSSGSAALVAAGEVDLALGGDSGGSIRMPSSFCGIHGMKPTYGLVPGTGAMPMENTIDHLGPMTATVEDNALLLEVLAGPDGLDSRQDGTPRTPVAYTQEMRRGVRGLRVGVMTEGFAWPESDSRVNDVVRAAGECLAELGAVMSEVSVPMHAESPAVWVPIGVEGAIQQVFKDNGQGFNWKGLFVPELIERQARWRGHADELAEPAKLTMVLGEYFIQEYHGRFYAKARNLGRRLAAAYDDAFSRYDVLVTPTTPTTAQPLPAPDAGVEEVVGFAFAPLLNTCGFDVTGHPAMSVPCGWVDDLPVGMQVAARHHDEATIYRVAYALQESGLHGRKS